MTTGSALALGDALLSAGAIVCLVLGYRAIRRREIERHRALMLGAFACSAAFAVTFVYRFVVFGFAAKPAAGAARVVYYVLMFAHEPIAVLSVPMATVTLILGLRRARAHRELARPSLVIWLISATTGVVLFLFLYVIVYAMP